MKQILLTNDDGARRPGLWRLYEVLKELGNICVVAPESARSSTGMSITLHKPLRLRRTIIHGAKAFTCSGTPSDCVIIALKKVLGGKAPDLVVSGINEGNNVSLQAIYGSGTVAAAVRAALMGIPAAAFSLAFTEETNVSPAWVKRKMRQAAERARPIVEWLLANGLPAGVDYLNVNFPPNIDAHTPVKITRTAVARYLEMVEERRDPRGQPYYWLHGKLLEESLMEPDTDVHAVFVEGVISITPMRVDASVVDGRVLDGLLRYLGGDV
ncbi:MAG: 5'/3'-nucleotidase SurE [Candidatus Caldarchaeum sp.]